MGREGRKEGVLLESEIKLSGISDNLAIIIEKSGEKVPG